MLLTASVQSSPSLIDTQCLKLKYEKTQMRKRCPACTWPDLNDFHAQYGRLIPGVYDFPVCCTAAWSWLPPQSGHTDSFLPWHGCNGIEGLIRSPRFHFLQVVWAQMSQLLSWKCSKKHLPPGSSWRLNQGNIGKHIADCRVLCKHGTFNSVDYLGRLLVSALAFWLSPHLCVSTIAQKFLWADHFFLLLCGPVSLWGSLAEGLGRAEAETGDG